MNLQTIISMAVQGNRGRSAPSCMSKLKNAEGEFIFCWLNLDCRHMPPEHFEEMMAKLAGAEIVKEECDENDLPREVVVK